MTDDIVVRLRKDFAEDALDKHPVVVAGIYKKECLEAADEIDRSRAKIQQLNDSAIFINNDWSDAICENFDLREENAELRDEIERLRAALREAREDILLRHNARGSEAGGTDEEAVSFIDAALAGEKADDAAT